MARFRKKVAVIEAALFDGRLLGNPKADSPQEVEPGTCPEWFPAVVQEIHSGNWKAVRPGEIYAGPNVLYIGTPDGPQTVQKGDWICYDGHFHPCHPGIFEATYEKVA